MINKTGTSMSSIIITKKAIDKKRIEVKKANARKERAAICLKCKYNNEGYCYKYKAWCGKVNYICLGIKNPYIYKTLNKKKKQLYKNNNKFSKKNNKEFNKLMNKYKDDPEEMIKKLKKKYKIK